MAGQQPNQSSMLIGGMQETLQVREGIEDHEEPGHAKKQITNVCMNWRSK